MEYLCRRPDVLPTVQRWFESEWPATYGAGGTRSAENDLLSYSHERELPLGLVAMRVGEPCGFAALKTEPFATHPRLGPWVGAAYVVPSLRGHGIGALLLRALELEAISLGHRRLYCATATSRTLLARGGWHLLEQVSHEGAQVGIHEKAL